MKIKHFHYVLSKRQALRLENPVDYVLNLLIDFETHIEDKCRLHFPYKCFKMTNFLYTEINFTFHFTLCHYHRNKMEI